MSQRLLCAVLVIVSACGSEPPMATLAPPRDFAYEPSQFTTTVQQPFTTSAPKIAGTDVAYSVAPPLPEGLALAAATGIVAGVPVALSSGAYVVTAKNLAGELTAELFLTVVDRAPAGLAYESAAFSLTRGAAVELALKPGTGGRIERCAVEPVLPAGLALDDTRCTITGTPTLLQAAATYTVTASNSGGRLAIEVSLAVNDVPPSIAFEEPRYTLVRGVPVAFIAVINAGGAIVSCSIAPELPPGLVFDSSRCGVGGTPTELREATGYEVTAENSGGVSKAPVLLEVVAPAPRGLTFDPPLVLGTLGEPLVPRRPLNEGGAPVTCVADPALPAGLVVEASSCTISGTPAELSPQRAYELTAANSGGETTASFELAVHDVAPRTLLYDPPHLVATKGVALSPRVPTRAGGPLTGCTVTPALPDGLVLDPASCAIAGTPAELGGTRTYTVTATNSGGSTQVSISLVVNDRPPSALVFLPATLSGTKGTALVASPTLEGGQPTTCATVPGLPEGLVISATTCTISGTPSVLAESSAYTVTASNSGGEASSAITLRVVAVPPSQLGFPSAGVVATNGTALVVTPTQTGGELTGCTVAPPLPAGLVLNAQSCAISGTPSDLVPTTSFTLIATNSGGETTTTVELRVVDVPPSSLQYGQEAFTLATGQAFTAAAPTHAGGALTSCAISPALPAGLTLDPVNCSISGSANEEGARFTYTVTAVNSGGSTTATFTLRVTPPAPLALSYATPNGTYYVGSAIAPNNPTVSGGAVAGYSVAPALPTGLSLHATTGVIAGTPTVASQAADYVVTAANDGGAVQATVRLAVADTSTSCREIPMAARRGDGLYAIDADGSGAEPVFDAWCDMTTDGGGWTLVVRAKDGTDASHRNRSAVGTLANPTQTTTAKLSDAVINLQRGGAPVDSVIRMATADGKRDYFRESREFNAVGDKDSINRVFDTWDAAKAGQTGGCDGEYNGAYHTGLVGWLCHDYMLYADNPGFRSLGTYQAGTVWVKRLLKDGTD